MIDCYAWTTDNGYKPRMMLEETELPHKIIPVNVREKAQMSPGFTKISPGHKVPTIVYHRLWRSGRRTLRNGSDPEISRGEIWQT
jgi:glutathione S-transferase